MRVVINFISTLPTPNCCATRSKECSINSSIEKVTPPRLYLYIFDIENCQTFHILLEAPIVDSAGKLRGGLVMDLHH